jgi:GMP synthase-like glutamine amidotransferase
MRLLAIVHQPDAGPGVFAQEIAASGARLETWMLPTQEVPPRPLSEYAAVLTFGGAMHADQEDGHPWLASEKALLARLLERRVPLLGVCLGAQLLAEAAGAPVRRATVPEIGWYEVRTTAEALDDPLIGPLAPQFAALQWHSYEFLLPPGAVPLAHSDRCLQAFRIADVAWAIQFHAEVTREDLETWVDEGDPDAVAHGVDLEVFRRQTPGAIRGWNRLGRALCKRFLAAAAART